MKKRYLLAVVFLHVLCCDAQQPVILNDDSQITDLADKSFFLKDETAKLGIEEILSEKYKDTFQPHHTDFFQFGVTHATVWIRFAIDNKTKEEVFLFLSNPMLDTVELYKVRGSEVTSIGYYSIYVADGNRQTKANEYCLTCKPKKNRLNIF